MSEEVKKHFIEMFYDKFKTYPNQAQIDEFMKDLKLRVAGVKRLTPKKYKRIKRSRKNLLRRVDNV